MNVNNDPAGVVGGEMPRTPPGATGQWFQPPFPDSPLSSWLSRAGRSRSRSPCLSRNASPTFRGLFGGGDNSRHSMLSISSPTVTSFDRPPPMSPLAPSSSDPHKLLDKLSGTLHAAGAPQPPQFFNPVLPSPDCCSPHEFGRQSPWFTLSSEPNNAPNGAMGKGVADSGCDNGRDQQRPYPAHGSTREDKIAPQPHTHDAYPHPIKAPQPCPTPPDFGFVGIKMDDLQSELGYEWQSLSPMGGGGTLQADQEVPQTTHTHPTMHPHGPQLSPVTELLDMEAEYPFDMYHVGHHHHHSTTPIRSNLFMRRQRVLSAPGPTHVSHFRDQQRRVSESPGSSRTSGSPARFSPTSSVGSPTPYSRRPSSRTSPSMGRRTSEMPAVVREFIARVTGEDGSDMPDGSEGLEELLKEMTAKHVHKSIESLRMNPADGQIIKQYRRRLKNRVYTRVARSKARNQKNVTK
eukprot:m.174604 g.174604  ORF g.174604 m.174604 type:complete len:462 (+) comp13856_c0_seq1:304-1689(+)